MSQAEKIGNVWLTDRVRVTFDALVFFTQLGLIGLAQPQGAGRIAHEVCLSLATAL